MRFIPTSELIEQAMLAEMGVERLEELFASIPAELRLQRELALPPGMAEQEQLALFQRWGARNRSRDTLSFLGGGSYSHFIPLTIDSLIQRGEFLTSYTPYQAEVSQGTLQAIFEFQTFITLLTGMEVANASVYDGASATAEAILMAQRLTRGRTRVLLAASLHPYYRRVVETYTGNLDITLADVPCEEPSGRMDPAALEGLLGDDVSCLVVQQPNFFGVVEDLDSIGERARKAGALLITIVTEALSLALLKPPGRSGADIVAGEAQSFGLPVYYGGPYLGFMATRAAHLRQLPGRISGQTVDAEGRRGFVLTLATREQHIRREKATSNICTNQNLAMTVALIYLTLMGREGLGAVARHNVSLLSYFRDRLKALPGYELRHSGPSFNEITLACPRPAGDVVAAALEKGIAPGIDLGRFFPERSHELLVAVTETQDRAAIDRLLVALGEAA